MTRQTVLVTGAEGYIGRHVVMALAKLGHRVIAVDRVDRKDLKNCEVFVGDVLHDVEFVKSLPPADVLVHLAWQDGFKHNAPSHLANLGFHYGFIMQIVDAGCKHVVVMGTMHEVGYHEGAISEDTPCSPLSLYGIAKNALRQALSSVFRDKPICFQWLRGFYIYGDDLSNHSIFTKILESAAEGKKSFPFTTGKNKYDFCFVDQLANMIAASATQTEVAGIINCCSGEPITLAEVVERFITQHGLDIKLEYGAFPDRPYDSPAIWGDATKIKTIMEVRRD